MCIRDSLQQMRSLEPACTVPVIILSAKILTAEDMSRLQEGVAVVLGKGLFSMEEMLSLIHISEPTRPY